MGSWNKTLLGRKMGNEIHFAQKVTGNVPQSDTSKANELARRQAAAKAAVDARKGWESIDNSTSTLG